MDMDEWRGPAKNIIHIRTYVYIYTHTYIYTLWLVTYIQPTKTESLLKSKQHRQNTAEASPSSEQDPKSWTKTRTKTWSSERTTSWFCRLFFLFPLLTFQFHNLKVTIGYLWYISCILWLSGWTFAPWLAMTTALFSAFGSSVSPSGGRQDLIGAFAS